MALLWHRQNKLLKLYSFLQYLFPFVIFGLMQNSQIAETAKTDETTEIAETTETAVTAKLLNC